MSKPLIVVDSEAKGQALSDCLEGNVEILQLDEAPFTISSRNKGDKLQKEPPTYDFTPLPESQHFVDILESAFDRDVFIALDSNVGGRYLTWMLGGYIDAASNEACKPKYLHLAGLTREEVAESFEASGPLQSNGDSGYFIRNLFDDYLRKHLQRLIGTGVGPGKLSLNFTSLTMSFFLADRDMEIKAFAPALKWEVNLELAASGGKFVGRLNQAPQDCGEGYFVETDLVKSTVESFRNGPITVSEISEEQIEINAPAPSSTTSIIEDVYVLDQIMPGRVCDSLKKLQHGVEVNGKITGLVSFPGATGKKSQDRILERIRSQVKKDFGADHLAGDGGGAFSMEGFYPLQPEISEEELRGALNDVDRIIYRIIRQKSLASQMAPAKVKIIEVLFDADGECQIRSECKVLEEAGYISSYRGLNERTFLNEHVLENLEEGQKVELVKIMPEKTPGFPPEYYTLENLYGDLADFSIEPESSASTLEGLLTGDYIDIDQDGAIHCKENNAKLNSVIARAFPTMAGINLSAYVEQTVGEVLSGRKPLDFALKQYDQTIFSQGKAIVKTNVPGQMQARRTSSRVIKTPQPEPEVTQPKVDDPEKLIPPENVSENIETDITDQVDDSENVSDDAVDQELSPPDIEGEEQAEQVVAVSDIESVSENSEAGQGDTHIIDDEKEWSEEITGLFEGEEKDDGSQTPFETNRATAHEVTGEIEVRNCPVCSRPMISKEDRFGRFWSCSGFPACRHSEAYEKDTLADLDCPICGEAKVISKITPTGKPFYVCPEADCEFMAWSRPHSVPCSSCGSPFLVEKKTPNGVELRCPKAGCWYTTSLEGEPAKAKSPDIPGKKRKVRVRRVKGGSSGPGGKKRKVRVVRRKKG